MPQVEFKQQTTGPSVDFQSYSPVGAAIAHGAQSLIEPLAQNQIAGQSNMASMQGHMDGINGIAPKTNVEKPNIGVESAYARSYMNSLAMQHNHKWTNAQSQALSEIKASPNREQEYATQLADLSKWQQDQSGQYSEILPSPVQKMIMSSNALQMDAFKTQGLNLVGEQELRKQRYQSLVAIQDEFNQANQIGAAGDQGGAVHATDLFEMKLQNLVAMGTLSATAAATKLENYKTSIRHGAFIQAFTSAAGEERQQILKDAQKNATGADSAWYARQADHIIRVQNQINKANFQAIQQTHNQNINSVFKDPYNANNEAVHQQVLTALDSDSKEHKQVESEYDQAFKLGNDINAAHDTWEKNLTTVQNKIKNSPGTSQSELKINRLALAEINHLISLNKNDPAEYTRTSNIYDDNYRDTAETQKLNELWKNPDANPAEYSPVLQLECQNTLAAERVLVSPDKWQPVSNDEARTVIGQVMPGLQSGDPQAQQSALGRLYQWKDAYGQYSYLATQKWIEQGLDPTVGLAVKNYQTNASMMADISTMLANKKDINIQFKDKLAAESKETGTPISDKTFRAGIVQNLSTYDGTFSSVAGSQESTEPTIQGCLEYAKYLYTQKGLNASDAQAQATNKLVLDHYAYMSNSLRIPNQYKDDLSTIIGSTIPNMRKDALMALKEGDIKDEYSINAPLAGSILTKADLADEMHIVSINDDTLGIVDGGGHPLQFKNKKGQWSNYTVNLQDVASYSPIYFNESAFLRRARVGATGVQLNV